MKYEKTQNGNPHELTINQHTFPLRSIERFAQADGCVAVYLIEQRKNIRVTPDNQIFCAKRNWDQRTEVEYMKEIEDKYQSLVDFILTGDINTIASVENQIIITDVFALWNVRVY